MKEEDAPAASPSISAGSETPASSAHTAAKSKKVRAVPHSAPIFLTSLVTLSEQEVGVGERRNTDSIAFSLGIDFTHLHAEQSDE